VAQWIAHDVNPYPPGQNPTGRRDPDAHADSVIQALEARCAALGVNHRWLPGAALQVAGFAFYRAKAQREAHQLDGARYTSACLTAFAKKLAGRDPFEPAFHLLLCEAFEQEAKDAWQVVDHLAIQGAQSKALGQASLAFRLDPQNATARQKVAGLQDKLFQLASGRPSSR
jgi:hypothetical protein